VFGLFEPGLLRQESLSALVGYLSQEGFRSFGYVAGGSNTVAREHILRVVFTGIVGEPDPVLIVLPDEGLHRQIASVALLVIGGVPALGLPNMMTVRWRMSSPAFLATAA
jgi:hypothetical protein